jgi:EmrB/QacA subfamily drug resistance transporter
MKSDSTRPWLALFVLALGVFMTLLDITIVNVAIPSIVDDIGASLDQVLWVLNAYSLAYAVLLITAGRLGDLFGPRNLFAAGVLVFTIASALSGLAHDPAWLILARGAQGVGAAMLAPQGLPIMTTIFPPQRRAGVFAIYGSLAGLAVLAGPTAGGFIVTHFGWRWIFYVNLPVGLLTLVLALLFVPDLRPGGRPRLDVMGVLLATAGLFSVVFGLIEGQRYAWGVVWSFVSIPGIIGAGAVMLALFLVVQRTRQDREPLLPLAVFTNRNYTLMTLVLMVMGFAMVGLLLPLTVYLQSVLGLSAVQAGLAVAPMPLASMLVSGPVAGLAGRFNSKYILMTGLILLAAGMAYLGWVAHADSSRWSLLPGLVVAGIGSGCVWIPTFSLATGDLQPRLAGAGSGVLSTIQELGVVLGSAVVGAALQNRLAAGLREQALAYSSQLPAPIRGAFVDSFGSAARSGLEVGRGQAGGNVSLPASGPAQVAQVSHLVFAHAFVEAMRPTMVMSAALLLAAAVGCFAIRAQRRGAHRHADLGAQTDGVSGA